VARILACACKFPSAHSPKLTDDSGAIDSTAASTSTAARILASACKFPSFKDVIHVIIFCDKFVK
jgi:hypothetical protein